MESRENHGQLSLDEIRVLLLICLKVLELLQLILVDQSRTLSSSISRAALHSPSASAMSTFLERGSDEDYSIYFRFNRFEFDRLFASFEENWRRKTYEECNTAMKVGFNRRRASAKLCLALTLRFMASGILGDDGTLINGLCSATYCRTLWFGINILYHTLRMEPDSRIEISAELLQESAAQFCQKDSRVSGLALLIDGKVHPAQNLRNQRQSRRNYNGMADTPAKKDYISFIVTGFWLMPDSRRVLGATAGLLMIFVRFWSDI